MKFLIRLTLACLTCALAGAGEPGVPVNQNVARILESSPLRFEPDTSVAGFVARGARYRFEFSKNEARLHATQGDLKVEFARASREARLEGQDPLRSRTNVYIGNDPAQWRKAVVNYSRLRVRNLYPGVDLSYYGNQGELEYDLNVAPGADPRAIRIKLHGEHAHLDADGNLIAGLIEKKPVAYQTTDNGSRVPVSSRYRKNRDGSFGFELGAYDRSRELVIDPVLTVSSYLYGSLQDIAYSVGVDSKGFIYVGGTTYSTDFTTNGNSYQSTNGGAPDVFVAKIDPNFRDVVYATYFGGTGIDTLGGLAVGPNGDMYLAGTTSSGNFPSINPYQQTLKSQSTTNTRNAFVAWFDANQNLNYSTYFGGTGSEDATAVAVDAKGNIWFTGGTTSNDMPLVNPIQNGLFFGQDMFVAEINPDTNGPKSLLYSTYLGGSHYDVGLGIAVAPDQTIWVVGQTFSPDIEINGQPLQGSYQGNGDGWVAHFDPSLGANGMLYASYLGGSDQDSANAVAVDSNGRAAIAGY